MTNGVGSFYFAHATHTLTLTLSLSLSLSTHGGIRLFSCCYCFCSFALLFRSIFFFFFFSYTMCKCQVGVHSCFIIVAPSFFLLLSPPPFRCQMDYLNTKYRDVAILSSNKTTHLIDVPHPHPHPPMHFFSSFVGLDRINGHPYFFFLHLLPISMSIQS